MDFFILLFSGFFGLVANWFNRWAKKQTKSSFVSYMKARKKHSYASLVSLIGSVVAMYSIGEVTLNNQAMAMAFLAGFAIDSAMNKAPEDF